MSAEEKQAAIPQVNGIVLAIRQESQFGAKRSTSLQVY